MVGTPEAGECERATSLSVGVDRPAEEQTVGKRVGTSRRDLDTLPNSRAWTQRAGELGAVVTPPRRRIPSEQTVSSKDPSPHAGGGKG